MTGQSSPVPQIAQLSTAHLDVLKRVAEYKSSKVIARELAISPHTVDQRLKRIMAIPAQSSFATARPQQTVAGQASELRSAQAAYFDDTRNEISAPSWLSLLLNASLSNDLSPISRTLLIAVILLGALLALAVVISIAEGLSRIV